MRFESKHQGPVAGVDEAGRGPWAGPVVAAAVILDPARVPKGLDDSKKLSPQMREWLYDAIQDSAIAFGVGVVEAHEIDEINILRATFNAMGDAVRRLSIAPSLVLVDGNRSPEFPCPSRTIVNGDSISDSIAAASVVAKVTRDRIMRQRAIAFPQYGFDKHKGYGTALHAEALKTFGPCTEHRLSFAPVRAHLDTRCGGTRIQETQVNSLIQRDS